MTVITVNSATDPRWQQLVTQTDSDVFHSPAWMRAIANTYDFEMKAIILLDEMGDPQAGIPYCEVEDIRGKRIVSIPFSDFCDPLVQTPEQWACLSTSFFETQAPLAFRCLHNAIPLDDDRLKLVNRAKWHKVDLQADLDTLWMALHGSARRAIRKAEKNGITLHRSESKADLRAFFDMHLGIRKYKYRLVAQPYSFFENIWEQFVEQDRGFILLAKHQQEVIGGIFFLEWQNGLYYKFNASSITNLTYRPNDMMVWQGMQLAKDKGLNFLDFGVSDWDQEGLLRYKRKFASEEKTISFLRYTPDVPPTLAAQQLGQLLPKLTDLFTDESVPDPVTEKAGEVLYHFFT